MKPPVLPFEGYRWRWLSVTPSEGILAPPVLIGVNRVLVSLEGKHTSSAELHDALSVTDDELKRIHPDTRLTLSRDKERNVIRNSGQYWKGTGLLEQTRGEIRPTELGRMLGRGEINADEFATLVVRNTVLPNPPVTSDEEMAKWRNAGLRIHPFEVILQTLHHLDMLGPDHGHITRAELYKVVIPMCGDKRSITEIAEAIVKLRCGEISVATWPNCVPGDNDRRLVGEFLIFLENFDILTVGGERGRRADDVRYRLNVPLARLVELSHSGSFLQTPSLLSGEVAFARSAELTLQIERGRVQKSVLDRSGQKAFASSVERKAGGCCILTGEAIPGINEAAHVVPVKYGGADLAANGILIRVDLHRLYDRQKIRILRSGDVRLTSDLRASRSYSALPDKVAIPSYVSADAIDWRNKFL